MAKNVDACTAKNLPREQTHAMVLAALSERVFTPKRVTLMLNGLLRHQRQAKTAEDARLITLTMELERATTGLDRLYRAEEEEALSIDDTLRTRMQALKARRSEVLTEMAKLKDRQALAVRRVNADTVKAFCTALKERFNDPTSGLGKAYLRLLVDDIKLRGNELVVRGSHRRVVDLNQAEFAELMGVPVRRLQNWEIDRNAPTGAARSLLKLADSGKLKR